MGTGREFRTERWRITTIASPFAANDAADPDELQLVTGPVGRERASESGRRSGDRERLHSGPPLACRLQERSQGRSSARRAPVSTCPRCRQPDQRSTSLREAGIHRVVDRLGMRGRDRQVFSSALLSFGWRFGLNRHATGECHARDAKSFERLLMRARPLGNGM